MNMNVTRCMVCHRILTDDVSIRIGMGSDCRAKLRRGGWSFPTPRWKTEHGHAVLIGLTGKVQPPEGDHSEATLKLMQRLEKRKAQHEDTENESD